MKALQTLVDFFLYARLYKFRLQLHFLRKQIFSERHIFGQNLLKITTTQKYHLVVRLPNATKFQLDLNELR